MLGKHGNPIGKAFLFPKGRSIFPYEFLHSNNVKIRMGGWVRRNGLFVVMFKLEGGSEVILTLFEFRNLYEKMDCPELQLEAPVN